MTFAHDVEEALLAAADLVNTAARGQERLPDLPSLETFAAERDYQAASVEAVTLNRVHRLRARLRLVWEITALDDLVAYLNEALADSQARPALLRHDGWGWHVHYTPVGAPLDKVILAEAAMAIVTLFQLDELGRLKRCAAPDCDGVLVDLSRNRSKRYCDAAICGNRANVAAYRARQRDGASE